MIKLSPQALTVVLKVGVFTFLAMAGLWIFGNILAALFGYIAAATLSGFAAAATANALAMRIWERGHLIGIGFMWNSAGVRNLLLGLAGGMASALLVILAPAVEGAAHFEKTTAGDWSSGVFLLTLLVFGAIGEEMLFHGYAFQVLMGALGPFATILPVAVLFGLMHSWNLNVTTLALVNTAAWGFVFGFAFWRSGDLWLPIGLHLGWNWILPLFGANLSGFTMSVTGYAMRWRPGYEWLSGGAYGPEASPLTSAALVVLFVWLMWKAPVRRQTPYLLREQWDEIGGPEDPAKE